MAKKIGKMWQKSVEKSSKKSWQKKSWSKNITFLQRQQINQLDEERSYNCYNKKFEIWIAEEVNRATNWVCEK